MPSSDATALLRRESARSTRPGRPSVLAPARPTARPTEGAYAIHDANNMMAVIAANVAFLRATIGEDPQSPDVQAALDDLDECRRRIGMLLDEALRSARGTLALQPMHVVMPG